MNEPLMHPADLYLESVVLTRSVRGLKWLPVMFQTIWHARQTRAKPGVHAATIRRSFGTFILSCDGGGWHYPGISMVDASVLENGA